MNQLPLISTTDSIDPVFSAFFAICLLLLIGITAVMLWFVYRYHRSRAPEPTSTAEGNLWLEIIWTVLPSILVMGMFYYGWAGYLALRNVPEGAMEVRATARMWSWSFDYPDGTNSTKLYVQAGHPVKVELVSTDVIHGFFIPAFRVKRDVVPGMMNHIWFVANKPGSYDIFCSEYCGTAHSSMISTVEALDEAAFAAWRLQSRSAAPPDGKALLEKYGCLSCHSLDGSAGVGPTLKGLYGSQVRVLKGDGGRAVVTADDAFIAESIQLPNATIVEGYQPIMPAFPDIPAAEIVSMTKFMKGLK